MARSVFKTADPETVTTTARPPVVAQQPRQEAHAPASVALQTPTRRTLSLKRLSQVSALVLLIALGGVGLSSQGVGLGQAFSKENTLYLLALGNAKAGQFHTAGELAKSLPSRPPEALGETDYAPLRIQIINGLIATQAWADAYSQATLVPRYDLSQIAKAQLATEGLEKTIASLSQLAPTFTEAHDYALTQLQRAATGPESLPRYALLKEAARTQATKDEFQRLRILEMGKQQDFEGALAEVRQLKDRRLQVYTLRTLGDETTNPSFARRAFDALGHYELNEAISARFILAAKGNDTVAAQQCLVQLRQRESASLPNLVKNALQDLSIRNPELALRYSRK